MGSLKKYAVIGLVAVVAVAAVKKFAPAAAAKIGL